MTGNVLIWISLALSAVGFGCSLSYVRTGDPKWGRTSRYFLYSSVLFLLSTFILITYYFVTSNLSIEYVLVHTKVGYPLKYKLAGVWAGDAGAVLVWSLIIGLAVALYDRLVSRKMSTYTRPFSLLILLVFTMILVGGGLFDRAPSWAIEQFPTGYGMKPLLTTDLMVIHPPLQLLGYGLTVIPLVGTLSFLIYKREEWTESSIQFARAAWIFYGIGIGLGAIWAYRVLGWGGYWGWDPVESASLMGWLALTPLLHLMKRHRDRGGYRYLAPALGALTFIVTIFAAFSTRAGVFGGVHQFGGGPSAELVNLLEENWILSNIFKLLIVSAFMLPPLLVYNYLKGKGLNTKMAKYYLVGMGALSLFAILDVSALTKVSQEISSAVYPSHPFIGSMLIFGALLGLPGLLAYSSSNGGGGEFDIRDLVEEKYTILMTVGVLVTGTIVILILLGMGAGGIEDQGAFNDRLPFFTIPLAFLLVACSTRNPFKGREVGYVLGIALVAGLTTWLLLANLGGHGFELGVYAVAAVTPIFKIDSLARDGGRGKLRMAGFLLLIAGLLGIVVWSTIPSFAWPFLEAPNVGLAVLMVILSAVTLLGAFSAYRGNSRTLSLLGAVGGIVAISHWVGAILSLLALVIIIYQRNEFSCNGFSLSKTLPILRVSSPRLVHFGLALLLCGFVLSTYMGTSGQVNSLAEGRDKSALGYSFRLRDSWGRGDGQGGIGEIHASLVIFREEERVTDTHISMEWWTGGGVEPHMMKMVTIESTLGEDVYLAPSAFLTPVDGWKRSMTRSKFRSAEIQAVSFEVKVLPGMTALWGGMWVMMVGGGVLVVTYSISEREARKGKEERWREEYKRQIMDG